MKNQVLTTNEAFELQTQTQEGELTVVKIVTHPNSEFTEGWWVSVRPEIFIRPTGTQDKLGLVYAFNIPVTPEKHFFSYLGECLLFTLFFPALPKGTTHIDIIEVEGSKSRHHFNFLNVPMSIVNKDYLWH